MKKPIASVASAMVVIGLTVATAWAQGSPAPGPTNPGPRPPQAKPGATLVINPTVDQCRSGWKPEMKWTKAQFDEFCHKLRASK